MKTKTRDAVNAFIERNKHALLLLYFMIYLPWFGHLERTVTTREFDTLKSKKVPQSLEIGLFFCQIFIFII